MDQIESCVPPGFRFHPTEEELVGYYLERKFNSLKFDIDVIVDIDLYRMEPWDIEEKCNLGYSEQNEWYFFSHKDRKYPTGTRTNRATTAGFWKATGRDKAVLSKDRIIGMRKTLVYYKGRAPNGRKSDWIMHEYRLQTSDHAPPQEEGWVVCRAFKKPSPSHRQGFGANWNHQNNYSYASMRYNNVNGPSGNNGSPLSSIASPNYTDHNHSLINQSPNAFQLPQNHSTLQSSFGYLQEQEFSSNSALENELITELPRLDSPTLSTKENDHGLITNNNYSNTFKWEVLLGSELMEEASLSSSYCNELDPQHNDDLGSFLGCFPDL